MIWDLAVERSGIHRFSTIFTAQNVRDLLSNEEGIRDAMEWCRKTAVTKVYVEAFRDGYRPERGVLERIRDRFIEEGFEVSGCVTTTRVGKPSTGWKDLISCYTDPDTQERLREIFEYASSIFDEIMIDDFWFTDCTCPECDSARRSRTVSIGGNIYRTPGDTWEEYRCELMFRLSQEKVLGPAKAVNPRARLIIKYPQWYDDFQNRGYDVIRETEIFDRIWVGTETRDYEDPRWGGTVQYEAYFIMRWLGGIGGDKCGGGWFDPYGTTENTYLEQARQTVLGGARESLLFCYGSLLHGTGPKNVELLRANIPELLEIAEEVRKRKIVGIAAYKPPNSHPNGEGRVFDFVGMMGLPLVPSHLFPDEATSLFLSIHSLKDPMLIDRLTRTISSGKMVLITDGMAERVKGKVDLGKGRIKILQVKGDPKSLLQLSQEELDNLRDVLLEPLGISFHAPNRVALYAFHDGSWVIENFNNEPVLAKINGERVSIPPRGWIYRWERSE